MKSKKTLTMAALGAAAMAGLMCEPSDGAAEWLSTLANIAGVCALWALYTIADPRKS